MHVLLLVVVAIAALATQPAYAEDATTVVAASNMQLIGHSDLNGVGKGGEGFALKQYTDGRRILFLAHESGPMCVSVLDVTSPEQPSVTSQIRIEADYVRCNSHT